MTVYLVGAGPGDPGLLTVRGAELLARAEVVVHDRLSGTRVLELVAPGAEIVAVGKTPRGPSTPQEDINELLVSRGRAGRTVVRLKGGDPFVFARGGEEAAALAAAGVAFEVVPGVSSAIAGPAYAGIPLTLRGVATSFTVVTGHEDPWASGDTDWEAVAGLARGGGTVVVLMGVQTRGAIAERLEAGGLPRDTPVAAVRWATRPEQQTLRTTLGELAGAELASPAVIVIGAVAAVDLTWFEARPLFGRRVIVTRAAEQSAELASRLRELGADVLELPLLRMADPDDGGAALAAAVGHLETYDWIVFASTNAVERTFARLRDARSLGRVHVAAIGPATEAALRGHGVEPDLIPEEAATAEWMVATFPPGPGRVLVPRSTEGRDVLVVGLRAKGWMVDAVDAYRPVAVGPIDARATDADVLTFASPSAVRAWSGPVPPVVACIGPTTAAAAVDAGFVVPVIASEHTAAGLADALAAFFGAPTRS